MADVNQVVFGGFISKSYGVKVSPIAKDAEGNVTRLVVEFLLNSRPAPKRKEDGTTELNPLNSMLVRFYTSAKNGVVPLLQPDKELIVTGEIRTDRWKDEDGQSISRNYINCEKITLLGTITRPAVEETQPDADETEPVEVEVEVVAPEPAPAESKAAQRIRNRAAQKARSEELLAAPVS